MIRTPTKYTNATKKNLGRHRFTPLYPGRFDLFEPCLGIFGNEVSIKKQLRERTETPVHGDLGDHQKRQHEQKPDVDLQIRQEWHGCIFAKDRSFNCRKQQ